MITMKMVGLGFQEVALELFMKKTLKDFMGEQHERH
jgi:hypothetical protein